MRELAILALVVILTVLGVRKGYTFYQIRFGEHYVVNSFSFGEEITLSKYEYEKRVIDLNKAVDQSGLLAEECFFTHDSTLTSPNTYSGLVTSDEELRRKFEEVQTQKTECMSHPVFMAVDRYFNHEENELGERTSIMIWNLLKIDGDDVYYAWLQSSDNIYVLRPTNWDFETQMAIPDGRYTLTVVVFPDSNDHELVDALQVVTVNFDLERKADALGSDLGNDLPYVDGWLFTIDNNNLTPFAVGGAAAISQRYIDVMNGLSDYRVDEEVTIVEIEGEIVTFERANGKQDSLHADWLDFVE